MHKGKKVYNVFNKVSAICMILALLWLTVSAPFVFSAQCQQEKLGKTEKNSSTIPVNEEESSNPLGSNTEEKAPTGNSFSEEYLHEAHLHCYIGDEALQHKSCGDTDTYTAFHGELLVPPPDLAV